jgi:hypothetical protein
MMAKAAKKKAASKKKTASTKKTASRKTASKKKAAPKKKLTLGKATVRKLSDKPAGRPREQRAADSYMTCNMKCNSDRSACNC